MAKKSAARASNSPAKSLPEPKSSRPFAPGYGFPSDQDKKGMLPWAWVAKKMADCHTYWLATIHDHDGRPHIMPVWGVWLDDAFFFSTARKSRKGRNLAANPACTITNDDGREAVIVEATASELKDSAVLERVIAAYKKKYKMDPSTMNEPIYVARRRTVFAFVEKTFPKSATRWTF
jgi:nitroimidazol reductase NimA-like FMN-containing flavoprotein (pyridoxamine 5'-phosphate oxidase superfamily)